MTFAIRPEMLRPSSVTARRSSEAIAAKASEAVSNVLPEGTPGNSLKPVTHEVNASATSASSPLSTA